MGRCGMNDNVLVFLCLLPRSVSTVRFILIQDNSRLLIPLVNYEVLTTRIKQYLLFVKTLQFMSTSVVLLFLSIIVTVLYNLKFKTFHNHFTMTFAFHV